MLSPESLPPPLPWSPGDGGALTGDFGGDGGAEVEAVDNDGVEDDEEDEDIEEDEEKNAAQEEIFANPRGFRVDGSMPLSDGECI